MVGMEKIQQAPEKVLLGIQPLIGDSSCYLLWKKDKGKGELLPYDLMTFCEIHQSSQTLRKAALHSHRPVADSCLYVKKMWKPQGEWGIVSQMGALAPKALGGGEDNPSLLITDLYILRISCIKLSYLWRGLGD